MIVMKFGGTSVQNSEAIFRMIEIVRSRLDKKPVIVVSALSKVTDILYKISDAAEEKNESKAVELVESLRLRHSNLARELLEGTSLVSETCLWLDEICDELIAFIKAVCVIGDLSPRSKARIISTGEYLSSTLICFAINAAGISTGLMDAKKAIITNNDYLKGEPDKETICLKVPFEVNNAFAGNEAVITQGFVAATSKGETTVLGRGGSDYSASLIGMALDAEMVEIWTDVNGVMTADPRLVKRPLSLNKISFEEAAEMAHLGAKVLHPMTIEPAVRKNIPIYVLNSLSPGGKGTGIFNDEKIEPGIKAVSCKDNILVINIFSPRMIDTSGFLNKVFGVFSDNQVSVDMISTSEANISVTVEPSSNVEKVVEQLSAFADVTVDRDKAQISVIGKNIISKPEIFSSVFSVLKGRQVYMLSQGATFINISLVVDKSSCHQVLCDIHDKLFK